jgi:hypothetical protein
MDAVVAFIANGEATKPAEPGERVLDDPAEHAKAAAVGRAATAEDRNNAAGGEAITMWLRIVATVALQDVGPSARLHAGSPVVLDEVRSRKQAARFQDLLQQPSHAYLGRANTRYADVTTNRKSPLVWMAAPLSILISDPNGCLTFKYSSSLWYPVRLCKNLE